MPSILDLLDAAAALRAGLPYGFAGDAPGLALAVLGLAAWVRWVVVGVRRALDE